MLTARQIICALDTGDLQEALAVTRRLAPHVGAFKVGHALTLPNGLDVLDRLRDAGASRIFLDLKFHDIPNSVALAVREAAKRGAWMMTLHIAGGPAMITAAAEEARAFGEDHAPLLVGVSVLTSLDQHILTDYLGVARELEEHTVALSKLGIDFGLDGVVCSAEEIKAIRKAIGHQGMIVTPG
ncbi:MAG: orotidine-5'-phosphate decarboxylase, partial [Fimbriimonas ginsengisoli]|nr:orotidine-5'-phosphate decarboxylase [Fimbriimonas ginsengisoli]